MSIYIPLLISIVIAFRTKETKVVQLISSICTVLFFLLILIFMSRNEKIIRFIPFTSIDDTEVIKLDRGNKFYLTRGVEPISSKKFVFSKTTKYDDLVAYIGESDKNLYLYVKDDSNIVYSIDLGSPSEQDEIELLSVYYNWISYGVLPKNTVRYKFLIFFMDI